jgi:hypothetical protein
MALSVATNAQTDTTAIMETDTVLSDSMKHELIIFDTGFDSYLATQPSMHYHSISYYKNRNTLYVQEWNNRYTTGTNPRLYENAIDYDPEIDYPLEIEYKLYYYFRYFEQKYNVRLLPGRP